MKKQAEVRDDNIVTIIPEYGRQRLLSYAESFRDLADLFEGEEETLDSDETGMIVDRQDYLWQRKLQENQELLAEHLKETAHIMAEVAKETCLYRPMGERRFRQMSRILRESGISLKNFFEMEHKDGHTEISLTMKYMGDKYMKLGESEQISVDDVADFISVAMNVRLCAAKNSPMYLTRNYNTYYFFAIIKVFPLLDCPPISLIIAFPYPLIEIISLISDNLFSNMFFSLSVNPSTPEETTGVICI